MKRQFITLLLLFLCVSTVNATHHDVRGRAESSVMTWIDLIDNKQYVLGWESAAVHLQTQTPKPDWLKIVHDIRKPLGLVNSRNVATATSTASDGRNIVFVFYTSFEHKVLVVETIETIKEADDKWRVSGYSVK